MLTKPSEGRYQQNKVQALSQPNTLTKVSDWIYAMDKKHMQIALVPKYSTGCKRFDTISYSVTTNY